MVKPTLLMTRPMDASRGFVGRLSKEALRQVDVICTPLLEIVATGQAIPDAKHPVIFTSANAVAFAGSGGGRAAYCVGDRTALAALAAGWQVLGVALTAENLIETLIHDAVPGPITHLAGAHRRGNITERLTNAGFNATLCVLYEAQPRALTPVALRALEKLTILPMFSPRTAEQFMQQMVSLRTTHAIALSEAVGESMQQGAFASLTILPEPKGNIMVRAVETLIKRLASP